ncbi:InlB B-repeat-containing protein [Mycoplasmatota bacterium]|nr:InlB B-repeat-containing protein [Mycoplasmatota bacterium]
MKVAKNIIILILLSLFIRNSFDVSAEGPYTVTFLDWNGKEIRVQTVEDGDSAIYFEAFRIGHEFVEWDQSLVNVTSDMTVYAVYEPIEYVVVLLNYDGTIIKSEKIPYGTILEPEDPDEREGYTFVGWSPEDMKITGDVFYNAIYEETKPEVPDIPEEPILIEEVNISLEEILVSSSDLVIAEVRNPVLIEKIDQINKYTSDSKVIFPELVVSDEIGASVKVFNNSIEKALEKEVSFDINLGFIDILINSANLAKAIDIDAENVVFKVQESSIPIKPLYNVQNMQGESVDTPVEIEILYNDNQSFSDDIIIEVTVSPLDEDGLYAGVEPTEVSFVEYDEENNTYKIISSEYDSINKEFKMTLSKSSVIIPMKLTASQVIEPDDFSFIDFILDLDQYILYIIGFGSFVVVYAIVYIYEYLRQKKL